MNIEIKDRVRLKESAHRLYNKLEDMMFSIIMRLPERYIPHSLMEWLDRYMTKRIHQLEKQNVKQNWRNAYLQKAVDEISNQQQYIEKAPSDI